MYRLQVSMLDLGADVKAVSLDLSDPEHGEPATGPEAAVIWANVLAALAAAEPWALDFFSHTERIRDFCQRHSLKFRSATPRSLVIPALDRVSLTALFERFESETFGTRAGGPHAGGTSPDPDAALEADIARRGLDAYLRVWTNYFFCAICDFSEGSLTLLSNRLWPAEIVRRLTPVLGDQVHISVSSR